MSETREFRVAYDERVLRRAASAFVLHARGGGIFLVTAFVLGSIYAVHLMSFGKDSRRAGFVTGMILCALVFAIWRERGVTSPEGGHSFADRTAEESNC
jgi:hypothetical protein